MLKSLLVLRFLSYLLCVDRGWSLVSLLFLSTSSLSTGFQITMGEWVLDYRLTHDAMLMWWMIELIALGLQRQLAYVQLFMFSMTFFMLSRDFISVYVFYELQLLPMFFLLVADDRVKGKRLSMLLLFFYSVLSGYLLALGFFLTVDALVFLSGMIKIALIPLHKWLPKVHVESDTEGSMILAGVSMKSGWWLHWSFGCRVIQIVAVVWFVWGLFVSVELLKEVQVKRWIALYSVTHVQAIYFLWIHVHSFWVLVGMLSHSLISVCLFFFLGFTVDKRNLGTVKEINTNTKLLYIIGLLLLGNGSFPLTSLWIFEYEMMLCWNALTPYSSVLVLMMVSYCNLSMLSGMVMWLRLKAMNGSVKRYQLFSISLVGILVAWLLLMFGELCNLSLSLSSLYSLGFLSAVVLVFVLSSPLFTRWLKSLQVSGIWYQKWILFVLVLVVMHVVLADNEVVRLDHWVVIGSLGMFLRFYDSNLFTEVWASYFVVEVSSLGKALSTAYFNLKYTYESNYLNTRSWLVLNLHIFCLVSLINAVEPLSFPGVYGLFTALAVATFASVVYLSLQVFVLVDFSGKFTHSSVLASEGRLFAINSTGVKGKRKGAEKKKAVGKVKKTAAAEKRVKALEKKVMRLERAMNVLKVKLVLEKEKNSSLRSEVRELKGVKTRVFRETVVVREGVKGETVGGGVGDGDGVKPEEIDVVKPDENGEFKLSTVSSSFRHNDSSHSGGSMASTSGGSARFRS